VDVQLKTLQKSMAQQQKISDDRPAQAEDFVLIDLEGSKDGKPVPEFAKTENFSLQIGKAAISEDFDSQINGMKTGDTKEFKVKFPKDFSNENLAGLEISFTATLNEIREEILPEINDALAKKAGPYESLDDLRNIIVDNLKQGYSKRVEQELNEQIFSELIAKTDFEVPDTMVEMELDGIVAEAERSFSYRNIVTRHSSRSNAISYWVKSSIRKASTSPMTNWKADCRRCRTILTSHWKKLRNTMIRIRIIWSFLSIPYLKKRRLNLSLIVVQLKT
jgi:trigger factor